MCQKNDGIVGHEFCQRVREMGNIHFHGMLLHSLLNMCDELTIDGTYVLQPAGFRFWSGIVCMFLLICTSHKYNDTMPKFHLTITHQRRLCQKAIISGN